MDNYFYPTLYWACGHLSMLGFKLIHVSKGGLAFSIHDIDHIVGNIVSFLKLYLSCLHYFSVRCDLWFSSVKSKKYFVLLKCYASVYIFQFLSKICQMTLPYCWASYINRGNQSALLSNKYCAPTRSMPWLLMPIQHQGCLLLTWTNFNPSMDK